MEETDINGRQLALITCSYGPDADRCHRLCRSVDRFVPEQVEHYLIVPHRDQHQFAKLANARRHIRIVEDVVPLCFSRAPVAGKWWLRTNDWPVRGWIMQQITKLCADHATDAEFLLFADSDVQFIRPFDLKLLQQGKRLRLHRVPGAGRMGTHLRWHHRASRLLGITPRYLGGDYVGQLITWRRSNLRSLRSHIEKIHGRPWHDLIADCYHFSEYTLYGAFVEHILGESNNGHFYCDTDICHCCWHPEQAEKLTRGADLVSDRAQALLLQSNLGLSPTQEDRMLAVVQGQIVKTFQDRS